MMIQHGISEAFESTKKNEISAHETFNPSIHNKMKPRNLEQSKITQKPITHSTQSLQASQQEEQNQMMKMNK